MDKHFQKKYNKYKYKYKSYQNRDKLINIETSNLSECKRVLRKTLQENEILREKIIKIYNYQYSQIPEFTS